jgi:hypothetical protein
LRPFTNQHQRLCVPQAVGKRLDVVDMIIPYFDLVSVELAKARESSQGIEVVVQGGNFQDTRSGLNFLRSSTPAGVTRMEDRPFRLSAQTKPRSLASSQTVSLGQEVRQASIVSS